MHKKKKSEENNVFERRQQGDKLKQRNKTNGIQRNKIGKNEVTIGCCSYVFDDAS